MTKIRSATVNRKPDGSWLVRVYINARCYAATWEAGADIGQIEMNLKREPCRFYPYNESTGEWGNGMRYVQMSSGGSIERPYDLAGVKVPELKLVDAKTGAPVTLPCDRETFRGEKVTVIDAMAPITQGSTGRVTVRFHGDSGVTSYYPSVVGLKWENA